MTYNRERRHIQFATKHVQLPLVREQFSAGKVVKLIENEIRKLMECSVVIERRVTDLEGDKLKYYFI